MSLDEQLSRYLAGDLTDAERVAIEAQLVHDPEAAAALADLRAVLDALDDLPEEATPPPLDPRVLPRRSVPWGRLGPWLALAAALLLWIVWPDPSRTVILGAGDTLLEGELALLAGDVAIDLDGLARISVEPAAGVVRAAGQNPLEDPMDKRTFLAGLAGAAVTVVVFEGAAVVRADDSEPVTVTAGERLTVGARTPQPAMSPRDRAAQLEQQIAGLDAELQQTRQALDEEQFTGALVRGQLHNLQGTPSPWPAEVPASMTPEAFEDALLERFAELDDVEVAHVDCSEYPCVAALRFSGDDASMNWGDEVGETIGVWAADAYGEQHSLSVNRSRFSSNGHEARYVLFAAHGGQRDDEVGTRTDFRIDDLVDQLGEEVAQEAEAEEAP